MVDLCTPCFLQCQVTLHPSAHAALARLNGTPMTVCLELSSTVFDVCHRKPPKARLAPPKLPEPQVHLVHIAPLLGDSRCRVPVQKQWDLEEQDSPQHVLAGSHKEDGCGGRLIKFCTLARSIGQSLSKSSYSKVLKNTSSSLMSSGPWV